jgi:hypothetical protein
MQNEDLRQITPLSGVTEEVLELEKACPPRSGPRRAAEQSDEPAPPDGIPRLLRSNIDVDARLFRLWVRLGHLDAAILARPIPPFA